MKNLFLLFIFFLIVSKLREHWEETASAVTARRNQLEDLLGDSHQFERRKQDVDQWLGRMENRLSKLAPVAGTADLIDSQHREQKVMYSDWNQSIMKNSFDTFVFFFQPGPQQRSSTV